VREGTGIPVEPWGTGRGEHADSCDGDRNGNGKGGGVTADGGHDGHRQGAQRGARAVGFQGKGAGGDAADADAWLQGSRRHTAHRGGGGGRQRRHRRPRWPPLAAVAPPTAGPPTSAPAPPRSVRPRCASADLAATAARRVLPPFGCAWERLPRQAGASGAAAPDAARRPFSVGCARRAARPPQPFSSRTHTRGLQAYSFSASVCVFEIFPVKQPRA